MPPTGAGSILSHPPDSLLFRQLEKHWIQSSCGDRLTILPRGHELEGFCVRQGRIIENLMSGTFLDLYVREFSFSSDRQKEKDTALQSLLFGFCGVRNARWSKYPCPLIG